MTLQFADPRRTGSLRIMLYSHDTLGYGHLRRNLLIARALSEIDPRPEILLIGGMREAGAFVLPPGTDCVTLPAYAKQSDGSYRPRELGGDLARLTRLRSATISGAAAHFDPDLLIVDNVPRGAQYELDETLQALRSRGRCRIVLGLRDVIDSPSVARRQWLRQRNFEAVRRYFEAVWIYGDPTLYDILDDCGMAGALGPIARHVGYLDPAGRRDAIQARLDAAAVAGTDTRPYVFCAVGGGRDGSALCEAFVRARMPAGHRGVLVTGTQMAEDLRARFHNIAAERDDMTVLSFLREPFGAMAGAARLVGMGGYNTTMELLSLGKPSLIVPRCAPRREQIMRTERLAARGLVSMLLAEDLGPNALSDWLAAPAAPRAMPLDMGGLESLKQLATTICGNVTSAGTIPVGRHGVVA